MHLYRYRISLLISFVQLYWVIEPCYATGKDILFPKEIRCHWLVVCSDETRCYHLSNSLNELIIAKNSCRLSLCNVRSTTLLCTHSKAFVNKTRNFL